MFRCGCGWWDCVDGACRGGLECARSFALVQRVFLFCCCCCVRSLRRRVDKDRAIFFRIFYCISLMLSWPHGHWNRSLSTHPERVWSCKGNGAWTSVNAGVRTNGRSIDCTTKGLRGTARRNRACGKQRTWERETSAGAGRGGAVTAETTTRRGKTRRRWRGRRCTRASGSPGARPCCSCAGTCPRGCRTSLRTRRSNVRARADVDMGAEVSA